MTIRGTEPGETPEGAEAGWGIGAAGQRARQALPAERFREIRKPARRPTAAAAPIVW
jgi:hypothetical protein